ncbi:MAG: MarC family protein [Phenylobacterium sp.]|uniref:MarC family protein n=1 Tax=Phenylobacterium sp. TaxID=1871053 RepID=UPI002716BC61|nr:MarC family protein [Phenylobacterium sp.]MDO9433368.1 MarC family protein [Phenylobacterium sp.]
MSLSPLPLTTVIGAFLLAFPALFSIVNPVGAAITFHQVTEGRSDRHQLAWRIALNALLILLGSLLLGSYILNFFGVSLGALRVAGGLVVAIRAWQLLMQPEVNENRKTNAAAPAEQGQEDVAFFPLTMPFTTGPGAISVAIALASQRPSDGNGVPEFFVGVSIAAILVALLVGVSYRWSGKVLALLGASGARVMSRLVAFLLLCVGVQIITSGLESLITSYLSRLA